MTKLKALDLFCCAGGASAGLVAAGFDVVGVDKRRSKNYPFAFIHSDVFEYLQTADFSGFSFIWSSPPCQFASVLTPVEQKKKHPNLIPKTREFLKRSGLPYIIENVENARNHLINPVMLCGSMFGLKLFRHRYFESNIFWLNDLPPCDHSFTPVLVSGQTKRRDANGKRVTNDHAHICRAAMRMPHFVNRDELSQAVPPVYAEYIGNKIKQYVETNALPIL